MNTEFVHFGHHTCVVLAEGQKLGLIKKNAETSRQICMHVPIWFFDEGGKGINERKGYLSFQHMVRGQLVSQLDDLDLHIASTQE